ncbi:von Willebrand factor A domain-containing protein 8 [Pseudolycoriella hygida]|uniref:von Willebrand factor A domain-containing protein 8 n=1 Tax=Pseudolycoriella hygida TaxID=35572 RepID=A0A9Q0NBE9_9DIPT|nr:von Willebrand factor A domain-containing protein 8 [Pseudolycoriella hygida]
MSAADTYQHQHLFDENMVQIEMPLIAPELLQGVISNAPKAALNELEQIVSFGCAILSPESQYPDFPVDSLNNIARIIDNNPDIPVHDAIYRLYPYRTFLTNDGIQGIHTLLQTLKIPMPPEEGISHKIMDIQPSAELNKCVVKMNIAAKNVEVEVPHGTSRLAGIENGNRFVETEYQSKLLTEIIQTFAVGELCLVGPKGCGKSVLVFELARLLNQTIEPMVLYQDMTARDLIQQRTTKINGDTIWRDSPLLRAAKNGNIAVLDGIHRIHNSTISILHRLIHDREVQLYDGTRLLRHDRYDQLLANGCTVESMNSKGVIRIHPSFRIIALAEPPNVETGANWLTPEMLSLFMFHEVRNLSKREELHIIQELYGSIGPSFDKIINLAHLMRSAKDPLVKNLSATLSTRQLLRIAHRMSIYSPENAESSNKELNSACNTIQRAFLAKFLPALPRAALESSLRNVGIERVRPTNRNLESSISILDNNLRIGTTSSPLYKTDAVTKVPDILFYDVPQHVRLLEHLLQDFLIGNHLLLVGNQGVGKNKIADKLLQLMNRPREYIQLHRDTTVQTLTLQPTVRDGIVVYEDSPLVKAVKNGYILVVDEADKAPTHVTCILKTLVENGEMTLSDGRKIVPYSAKQILSPDYYIQTHPDFRMIVLANRPGFPFLGNDFFASLGDLFSCHAVDNPSTDSEIFLLQQYGPNVPTATLMKLVSAFAELRSMADVGQLSYPYSTREVVNIVRHLEKFPNEDLSELIGNVLDFDRYTPESLEQVTDVLQKHGLEIGSYAKNELALLRKKRDIQLTIQHSNNKSLSTPKHGKEDPENKPHVGGNTWAGGSGGRDTAGLGGRGGPYRLDKGHNVHQVSDQEKDDVPEHVKEAARAMNRKAFEERLKEIKMSAYDHSVYEEFRIPVKNQIQQLRIILTALQAKSKERHWQKHQTSGELDDNKLIEGITGERTIYRKRANQDPEPGQPQEKPKRLKLVVDVSGSMYRFNGYDNRLDRELEAVVMVMEAFEGFEQRVQYDIVGHSGEADQIVFVDHKNPPKDDKLRLQTIKTMHAHSQFCWSGDNTVNATKIAVDSLAKEEDECDEAIVIILSDANLSRYGISPQRLAQTLTSQEPKVQAYTIFIGSLDNEAQLITKSMPAGRSFICMDLKELPQILKQIFASSVLYQSKL